MVVADQIIAAVVVSPAGVALLTPTALPVLTGPFRPGDHRKRDPAWDGESGSDASLRPPALQPLAAVVARRARVVFEAPLGAIVVSVPPGRARLSETAQTNQGEGTAERGLDHRAA